MVSKIVVRNATKADRPLLTEFIRDHWSANHVFVGAPEVFDWQYLQQDDRFNMVLAEVPDAPDEDRILGVLGFIPTGRFDADLKDKDILLALWKVREGKVPPGLGLQLLKFIQSEFQPRMIGAIGISDIVGPIYKALGYTLGKLHHAAIFAPQNAATSFMASGVPEGAIKAPVPVAGASVERFDPTSAQDRADVDRLGATCLPLKTWGYVEDRYLEHPWYQYALKWVLRDGQREALVVWREVQAEGAKILRIVDVIGGVDWVAQGHSLLATEVENAGAEYIDLMQFGTDDALLKQGGWVSPDWVDGLILPNYFAPFERRNIEIKLSFKLLDKSDDLPVRMYRADSDQDRPNRAEDLSGKAT